MSSVAAPKISSVPRQTVVEVSFARRLTRFLWLVGGFDRAILDQPDCSSVRAKYSCMGALVFVTSAIASFSSGYAVYTVFKKIYLTIPIAILWGTLIFFLDRYLVSSSRKTATIEECYSTLPTPLPYKVKQGWHTTLTRMALAMLVGIVVAKPIEMRLMRPIVDDFNRQKLSAALKDSESGINANRMNEEFKELSVSITRKEEVLGKLTKETQLELNGESASGQPRGNGPLWTIKKQAEDTAREELAQLRARQDQIRSQIQANQFNEHREITGWHADQESQRSFISDYQTIKLMEAEGAKGSIGVALLSWFLSIFFILVEMSPVMAKTLSPFDPYDAALQKKEHRLILHDLSESRRDHHQASNTLQS